MEWTVNNIDIKDPLFDQDVSNAEEALGCSDLAGGPQSDDFASYLHASHSNSLVHPPLQSEGLESSAGCGGALDGSLSIPTSFTTSLPGIGPLLDELPGIIGRAAARKGLSLLPLQEGAPTDDMLGVLRFHQPVKLDSLWSHFPAIIRY